MKEPYKSTILGSNVTAAIPSRTVFHFLNARAVYEPARTTLLTELYDEYREWCQDHGWPPCNCKWFSRFMREHALNRGASLDMAFAQPGRLPCYCGIGLGPHPRDVAKATM